MSLERDLAVVLTGGAQFGVNYVTGSVLVGAEADISGSTFSVMHEGYPYDGAAVGQKVNMLSTARLRIGFISGQTLAYLTGGLAVTSGNVTLQDPEQDPGFPQTKTTDNLFAAGWVIGAGVEQALSSNVSLKLEYLHAETSGKATTVYDHEEESYTSINKFRADILRTGVNYKF